MIDIIRSIFNKEKDTVIAEPELVAGYNTTRTAAVHKTFCRAPSVNMYFTQDGKVKVCCNNFHYVIGRYPEQSISEIWNSKEAESLRAKMRQFDLSAGCDVCEYDFKHRNFNQVPARHFDGVPAKQGYPGMMEFLLTNSCNLECVMCRGENSSLIRKNREKLPPIVNPYGKEFLEQLEPFIPYLHETRFSGSGEAFSIDLYYEIWDMIIERNPNCLIMVQTNGTILTARGKEMLERGNFEIGVSIDSLQKETYESIRLNARLDKVMANIRYFHAYSQRKNNKFSLSACIMRQNWRELPAFINFCNELNAAATLHKVWWPREYALYNLPEAELAAIYNELSGFEPPGNTPVELHNRRHYKYFVSVVKDWMARAPQLEQERITAEQLADDELMPYIKEKFTTSIAASDLPENERETNLLLCLDKLGEVLLLCNETHTREKILRWVALLPSFEIVSGFTLEPAEFIFSEASRYRA